MSDEHEAQVEALYTRVVVSGPATIPLYCPWCGKRHVDEGEWATKTHAVHLCVNDAVGEGCQRRWQLMDTDGLPFYFFGAAP